jgi:hypothetical protein
MKIDMLVQVGQIGTLLIGFVGIFVALLNQRRQLNAQMFVEFSGRFQQLIRLFPTEAWLANHNPSQPLPPSSPELTDCTLYCLQFVADVYLLRRNGYISKNLWELWDRGIQRTLTGPVFRREWEHVAPHFAHHADYFQYMNRLMRTPPQALSTKQKYREPSAESTENGRATDRS